MGLFRKLGRRVQRFKTQAESASRDEGSRTCRNCGEPVHADRQPCPNCGTEDPVNRGRGSETDG